MGVGGWGMVATVGGVGRGDREPPDGCGKNRSSFYVDENMLLSDK